MRIRAAGTRSLLMGIAVALALLAAQGTAHATFAGGDGKIAFQTGRDGNLEIYSINFDGTGETRLTNNPATDEQPAWSPDGTKIAFDTNRDGNHEIYTMNADGTGLTRITNNAAFDEYPSWSPDGTKIVFDSGRDDSHGEIYTMNANGTNVTRLTNDPGYDYGAVWSPDGTKIAWQSSRNAGQYDIFTMNAAGTGATNLTNNPSTADQHPNWSPDGTQIAYDQTSGSANSLLVVMSDTGTIQHTTNTSSGSLYGPSWIPDGSEIVFGFNPPSSGDTGLVDASLGSFPSLGWTAANRAYPDYQPLNSTYARPRGATPMRIPLLPAMKPCTGNTTWHRGSIHIISCYSPQPESSYLTVGSPEHNGVGANSVGSFLLTVRTTPPEDGLITVNITDVRCLGASGGCAGPLSDYSGYLSLIAPFRITDKNAGPIGSGPSANGTTIDLPLAVYTPCATTASTTVGSTCSVTTSINSILGSTAIVAGTRAMWQIAGTLDVNDGGPDGLPDTTAGNTLFATGGVFFP